MKSMPCIAALCAMGLAWPALAQTKNDDVEKLRAELAVMRAVLADLKLQLVELKKENDQLKSNAAQTPPESTDTTKSPPITVLDPPAPKPLDPKEASINAAAVFYFTEAKIQHGLELSLINKTIAKLNDKGKKIAAHKDVPLPVKKAEVAKINTEIQKLQSRRRALVSPNYIHQPMLLNGRKVGTVGHHRGQVKIIRILNPTTCLISVFLEGRAQEVWLKDTDTNGLRRGQNWRLPDPVEVAGSQTYQTALGTQRTALVWKRFNPKPYTIEQIRRIMDAGPTKPQSSSR